MKITPKLSFTMCILAGSVGGHAHAETVENYIQHNHNMRTLDQSIERYDRLVKIAEAQQKLIEINNPDSKQPSADQNSISESARYFVPGSNGELENGQSSTPQNRLTEDEQAEADRVAARSQELGLMDNARIVEVFRNNGMGSSYGAVINTNGNARQIQPGDMVSQWKVERISLDLITLQNQKYDDAVVNLKQIR